MGSGRYIECGVVDLSTGSDSSYRLADVDMSTSRPFAGDHPAPLVFSACWLRKVGTPVWKGSACRQGRGRRADMCQPGLPTLARQPADIPLPGTPTLPPLAGGNSLRPVRRNPPPYMAGLSALLDGILRLTCIKVGRRVIRSKAESCLKYGGETERGGRRVVRTWSGSLAGLMRRYPTAALRSTDIADSVDRVWYLSGGLAHSPRQKCEPLPPRSSPPQPPNRPRQPFQGQVRPPAEGEVNRSKCAFDTGLLV